MTLWTFGIISLSVLVLIGLVAGVIWFTDWIERVMWEWS